MKKLISSGGLIVNKNRVLLIKKEKTWIFPKGKVKEGESLIECAKREIKEEVGIDLENSYFYIGTTNYRYLENNEEVDKTVHYFLFFTNSLEIKLENTFLGYGWFYFNEALKFITYKNDKKILKIAIKKLREVNLPPLIEK